HVLPPRPTPPTLYTLSLHDALPISLVNLRGQARIDQNRPFRLAQHVDEAGSDDHTVRVESALAGSGGKIPNRRNPSIANADIARIPGRPCAVDDVAVSDDQIERLRRLRGTQCCCAQERDRKEQKGSPQTHSEYPLL